MILSSDTLYRPIWGKALLIAGSLHVLAIGALFVRFSPAIDPMTEAPAIAVDMASPASLPAPIHDAPTPRQIEAPQQVPQEQPKPKKLPFDPPPLLAVANTKPDVVLPLKKEDLPRPDKASPLPPAPATTELAAPDLKPDTKTTALITNGASAGKASATDLWDARIRSRIELTKRYPGVAARQKQQDDVDVVLTMDRGGRLLDVRVRSSLGFALLNDAALDAVRRAAPFPRPPKEIEGDPIRLSVIVRFFQKGR